MYAKTASLLFSVMAIFSSHIANTEPSLIQQAQALQADGKSVQAYQLLQEKSDDLAGNIEFDYLLGITALDAGEPLQAVFALERVLDVQPDHSEARAELARAYYLIGENAASKAEFEKVQKTDIPPEVNSLINRYLGAIDEREKKKELTVQYALKAGIGSDSNVNSSTDDTTFAIPAFSATPITLTGVQSIDSPVGLLEGDVSFIKSIKPDLKLYGDVGLDFYNAFDESKFSTRTLKGSIGLQFLRGINNYRIALVANNFAVDSKSFRNLIGISGQWQHTVDARNQLVTFLQIADLKYPKQSASDATQLSAGLTWLHAIDAATNPVVYITGYYGIENEKDSLFRHLGKDFIGVRLGGQMSTSRALSYNALLTYQTSEYGGTHPAFMLKRDDDFLYLKLGAKYKLENSWEILPEIIYTDVDSNINFFAFDRTQFLVSARKEF